MIIHVIIRDVVSALTFLLRAGIWGLLVLQVAAVVTALRARRWVRAPAFTWCGVSREDAARILIDHIGNVQDVLFAFPSGVFAEHPSRHNAGGMTVRTREANPRYRDARPSLKDFAVGLGEAAIVLAPPLCKLAAGLGFFVGLDKGESVLGLGAVGGAVAGAATGIMAGFLAGAVLALIVLLVLTLIACVLCCLGWLLTTVYRPIFRSRIDASVVDEQDGDAVSVTLRFRGLSAYAIQHHVFAGVGPALADGTPLQYSGNNRLPRLAWQHSGCALVVFLVGLFVVR